MRDKLCKKIAERRPKLAEQDARGQGAPPTSLLRGAGEQQRASSLPEKRHISPNIDWVQGPKAWSKNDRAGSPRTSRPKSPGQLGPGRWQAAWSTDAEVEKGRMRYRQATHKTHREGALAQDPKVTAQVA